jgi:hypothetical protein
LAAARIKCQIRIKETLLALRECTASVRDRKRYRVSTLSDRRSSAAWSPSDSAVIEIARNPNRLPNTFSAARKARIGSSTFGPGRSLSATED